MVLKKSYEILGTPLPSYWREIYDDSFVLIPNRCFCIISSKDFSEFFAQKSIFYLMTGFHQNRLIHAYFLFSIFPNHF